MSLTKEILKAVTFRRTDVEAVVDADKEAWCGFDHELGYVPRDIVLRDGLDFCRTTYTHEKAGHRKLVNYSAKECRINTYGDSFTQCQQVSDDETWQERLAAHLGEPIRNFGCGGHSLYVAYRRAVRMEATECAAENIVFTIYDDDHVRNLDTARWIRTHWKDRNRPRDRTWPLHGLPWAHVRFSLSENRFVEIPGLCKSAGDLLDLCETENFQRVFKDDQIVRCFAIEQGGEERFDDLEAIAEALDIKVDFRSGATRHEEAAKFRRLYGLKSSMYVLDKFLPLLQSQGKKIFIPLAYGEDLIADYLRRGEHPDAMLIDYLKSRNVRYFDMLERHREDYADFKVSPEKYLERYYIPPSGAAVFGHYNSLGNLFFAMSIKRPLVELLNPKPHAFLGDV